MGTFRASRLFSGVALVAAAGLATAACAPAARADAGTDMRLVADGTGRSPVNLVLAAASSEAVAAGRPLLVPSGNYLLGWKQALPAGLTMKLAPGARFFGDRPESSLLQLGTDASIEGGVIENTSPIASFDIDILPSSHSVAIRGVTFRGVHSNAVYLNSPGISSVTVSDCTFDRVSYGVLLNPGAISARSIRIAGNRFLRSSADPIEINAATGGGSGRVRDVTVVDNTITSMTATSSNSGLGVGLAGVDGFTVRNNLFTGARNEAVHVEDHSGDGTIIGNTITGGGVGYRPAIAIYPNSRNVSIRNNRISHFAGTGIGVLWDSGGSSRGISIDRNAISGVSATGISVSGAFGTGPFSIASNTIDKAGRSAIAVLGGHALTTVAHNHISRTRGPAIYIALRGSGKRIYTNNTISEVRRPKT